MLPVLLSVKGNQQHCDCLAILSFSLFPFQSRAHRAVLQAHSHIIALSYRIKSFNQSYSAVERYERESDRESKPVWG